MRVKVKGESASESKMIFQILTGMKPRNPFPGSGIAGFQKTTEIRKINGESVEIMKKV